jgi:predicted phage-related endonuclease
MSDLQILEMEQRSPEWFEARRGLITASVVGKLLTPTLKVADNDTSRGIITSLVAERVTTDVEESYMNRDMERGVLYEPVIRDRYAEVKGVTVREVGLMIRTFPEGARLGASPDGLIGDDGGLECKAPRSKGQVQTILADAVPGDYMAQVQTALLVSGREWWDYASASAGRLYIKRVLPDARWHDAITEAVVNADRLIEKAASEYRELAASLPSIAPYVSPYEEVVI